MELNNNRVTKTNKEKDETNRGDLVVEPVILRGRNNVYAHREESHKRYAAYG